MPYAINEIGCNRYHGGYIWLNVCVCVSIFHCESLAFGLGQAYCYYDLNSTLCMLENFQARPLLMKAIEHREFGDLPDPRMENRFDENEMFHMIGAAAACIRHSAAIRPRMGQVT